MQLNIIPFPIELSPKLPTVLGNVDYKTLEARLRHIDTLLISSGVESLFIQLALNRWAKNSKNPPTVKQQLLFQSRSILALRCGILGPLLGLADRPFSLQIATSPLYQWFCKIGRLVSVKVPSKSQVQRFAHWLPAEDMDKINAALVKAGIHQAPSLNLEKKISLLECYLDSTCLKTNIHFPTDWVLLRDAVRTLMKATLLIRKNGLKSRMESPESFLRKINRLSMDMTHSSRREGARKRRKGILRKMKRLVATVRDHARRHRNQLDKRWEETDWTRKQAELVLQRIDHVLEQLPRAQKQAHERIIGERQVENSEKILSLYETETRVIVRGKAGAEVEFGNTLLVAENEQGVILDAKLYKESAPADSQTLFDALTRIWENLGAKPKAVVTDRGFNSKKNSQELGESPTKDLTCPRNPDELKEKMKDPHFARAQKRRAQCEGRIGILKHGFYGEAIRAKGYENRQMRLKWAVLTHNLWKMAQMRSQAEEKKKKAKAA